jgi:CheY-like chemotaxis protein
MPPTLLVVDDHPLYLNTVCEMLELLIPQVSIRRASNGSAALRLVQEQGFDLLLLDYQLQTMTGTDLVRQMRARAAGAGRPLPPVVIMSSQPDVALFARTLGVEAYLPKPMEEAHITTTIMPLLSAAGVVVARRPLLWSIRRG